MNGSPIVVTTADCRSTTRSTLVSLIAMISPVTGRTSIPTSVSSLPRPEIAKLLVLVLGSLNENPTSSL